MINDAVHRQCNCKEGKGIVKGREASHVSKGGSQVYSYPLAWCPTLVNSGVHRGVKGA